MPSKPKIAAIAIAAAALFAFVLSASAPAATKTCFAHSSKVAGGTVTGILASSNVNDVQARFATCVHARKVMSKVLALGIEEPRSVRGFYCRPSVLSTTPEAVRYTCTFRGADTPMFVKLTFSVVYES